MSGIADALVVLTGWRINECCIKDTSASAMIAPIAQAYSLQRHSSIRCDITPMKAPEKAPPTRTNIRLCCRSGMIFLCPTNSNGCAGLHVQNQSKCLRCVYICDLFCLVISIRALRVAARSGSDSCLPYRGSGIETVRYLPRKHSRRNSRSHKKRKTRGCAMHQPALRNIERGGTRGSSRMG